MEMLRSSQLASNSRGTNWSRSISTTTSNGMTTARSTSVQCRQTQTQQHDHQKHSLMAQTQLRFFGVESKSVTQKNIALKGHFGIGHKAMRIAHHSAFWCKV